MIKEAVVQPAAPAMSAGTPKAGPSGAKAQDRIARRAYELYEQRGRQDGLALEDWLRAERQLAGAASQ